MRTGKHSKLAVDRFKIEEIFIGTVESEIFLSDKCKAHTFFTGFL